MNRKTNETIVNLRNDLRTKYSTWNHSKKSGVEHLPEDPDSTDINRVKTMLGEEMQQIQAIQSICESLAEEINKEWREV